MITQFRIQEWYTLMHLFFFQIEPLISVANYFRPQIILNKQLNPYVRMHNLTVTNTSHIHFLLESTKSN